MENKSEAKIIHNYLSKIGSAGGLAGTGEKKRRSVQHYKKMLAIRLKNRAIRQKANAEKAI